MHGNVPASFEGIRSTGHGIIGPIRGYLMRLSVDDRAFGIFLLVIGTALVTDAVVRNHKKTRAHVEPVGTSWIQNQGL